MESEIDLQSANSVDDTNASLFDEFYRYLSDKDIKNARKMLREYNIFNNLKSRKLNEDYDLGEYKFTKRDGELTLYKKPKIINHNNNNTLESVEGDLRKNTKELVSQSAMSKGLSGRILPDDKTCFGSIEDCEQSSTNNRFSDNDSSEDDIPSVLNYESQIKPAKINKVRVINEELVNKVERLEFKNKCLENKLSCMNTTIESFKYCMGIYENRLNELINKLNELIIEVNSL